MRFLVFLVLFSACANVTTMQIKRTAPGVFSISSGKDVKADIIDVQEAGGLGIHVAGYSSMANTDAINAQANREIGMVNAVSTAINNAMQAGMKAAAKGMGVP